MCDHLGESARPSIGCWLSWSLPSMEARTKSHSDKWRSTDKRM